MSRADLDKEQARSLNIIEDWRKKAHQMSDHARAVETIETIVKLIALTSPNDRVELFGPTMEIYRKPAIACYRAALQVLQEEGKL
jgi:hypothetical protein